MSKFGWDLPPGVTHRMIEEAAGGDPAAEAFAEAFYEEFARVLGQQTIDNDTTGKISQLMEWCWEEVSKAYGDGYKQGMSDEGYARDYEKSELVNALVIAEKALSKATDGDAYSEYMDEFTTIRDALKGAGK